MAGASDNILEALRQAIRKEMNDITDRVATGECSSFEHYRSMTGFIEGLAWSERLVLDMDERIRNA